MLLTNKYELQKTIARYQSPKSVGTFVTAEYQRSQYYAIQVTYIFGWSGE